MASLEAVARDAAASRDAMQSEMVLMRKQLNRALEAKAAVDKVLFRPLDSPVNPNAAKLTSERQVLK